MRDHVHDEDSVAVSLGIVSFCLVEQGMCHPWFMICLLAQIIIIAIVFINIIATASLTCMMLGVQRRQLTDAFILRLVMGHHREK